MVFSVSRNKTKKQQQLLDVQEAYNLWDILKSMYAVVERIQIWKNYAHDPEFGLILSKALFDFDKEIKLLEKELQKYGIKGPKTNRAEISTSVNSEVLFDEFLAHDMFLVLQEHLEMFFKAFIRSTTNDNVRKLFYRLLSHAVERISLINKYLKIKGWIESPPLYPLVPNNVSERLDSGEVFHLWDHLTYRYDNIEKTEIFHDFVFDGDFKLLLSVGLQGPLKKQTLMLEKELKHFGIPVPKRPPTVVTAPKNTEILSDEFVYKDIFSGMHGAAVMHAQALKQSTTNDRIRGIFEKLLLSEVGMIDNLIKLGKLKGWLNPTPQYRL